MAPRVKLPRHGWTFAVALLMCAALSPAARAWSPEAPSYGTATQSNLAVTMSDGTVLRANVSFPTDPKTGNPAPGPFPVLLTQTPYGKDNLVFGAVGGGGFTGASQYLV